MSLQIFFEIKILKLIPDVSLTVHVLYDCTLWMQWWHSLQTDPSAAFSTHTKAQA